MERVEVAIVIPAHNEEATISKVIAGVLATCSSSVAVVVVSDASTDRTVDKAERAGAIVINLENNLGYAGALAEGLSYSFDKLNVEYAVTMDADGQHLPTCVSKVINLLLEERLDLVIGKRPSFARFSEYLYSVYFSRLYKISDPLCGLKGYSKKAFGLLGRLETYDSIGTQLIWMSRKQFLGVKEINIEIKERLDEPRFGSGMRANLRILNSLKSTIRHTFFS